MDNKKQNKKKKGSATTEQVDSAQPQIKEFNGGVTAEQIGIWKNQHGRIAEVRITDDEVAECHVGYFRRPDMKTMQAVNATSKTDEVKAKGVIQWVDRDTAADIKIRYLTPVVPDGDGSIEERIDKNSLSVGTAKAEAAVKDLPVGEGVQFFRIGYFARDAKFPDEFNRVVELKSSYKA